MFTDVQILVNTFHTVSEEVDDAGTKEGERRGGDTRSVSKIYLFHLPPLPLPSSFRLVGSSENAPPGAGDAFRSSAAAT